MGNNQPQESQPETNTPSDSDILESIPGADPNLDKLPIQQVDHIAIAVQSVNQALSLYHGLFGMEVEGIEEVESEQVRAANLHCGNIHIELLEPLHGEGPIQEYLEKNGPGLHHICLRVNNIQDLEQKFRDAGYEPIYDSHQSGIEGAKINFLHPHDTFGVLIELREIEE